MAIITGEIEYVTLCKVQAHYEMYLSDDLVEGFKQLPKEIQKERIQEDGELLVDDFTINDLGDIYEINIE